MPKMEDELARVLCGFVGVDIYDARVVGLDFRMQVGEAATLTLQCQPEFSDLDAGALQVVLRQFKFVPLEDNPDCEHEFDTGATRCIRCGERIP